MKHKTYNNNKNTTKKYVFNRSNITKKWEIKNIKTWNNKRKENFQLENSY